MCKNYEVQIENIALKANLILLEPDELNVILGMDFMT